MGDDCTLALRSGLRSKGFGRVCGKFGVQVPIRTKDLPIKIIIVIIK